MPMYPYECTDCGHVDEEYQSIRDEKLSECPVCRGNYEKRVCQTTTTMKEYKKPIEMHSIALTHQDDIEAFCRRNPGIQCSTDPRDELYGVPVVKTRHEKTKVLKTEGWAERN